HDRDAALDHPLPRRSLGGRPALPRGRRRHRRGHPIPAPAHGRDPTRVRSAHPHDGGRPMTSTHAPLETTSPLGFARRFLSRRASWLPVFAALALLIVIFVAAQAYFGNFLTPRVISALLLDNAYLFILAVGMTFVIITGGIDLSVGAVMAFTGMFGATLLRDAVPSGVVVPVMLLLGAAFGLVIGILVQYFDVQPFIASLAAMFGARGLAFMVSLDSIKVTTPEILWLQ